MEPRRKQIPKAVRSEVLLANRHLCCVCQKGSLQIHHINGDNSDNRTENLAVLCVTHHDMATAPQGITARLGPRDLAKYKRSHEAACALSAHKRARGRTAFFMVDYKNVERIRQLYAQLSPNEYVRAFCTLADEFEEESELREQQGYSCSLEATTDWNGFTRGLLMNVKNGEVHPEYFKSSDGHRKDPYLPTGIPYSYFYDVWVQIMVRALLANRPALPIEDLADLDDIENTQFEGRLVTLSGEVRGNYVDPAKYETTPVFETKLSQKTKKTMWRSLLKLKTHYVYSDTAAQTLSGGRTQGLVMFRGVNSVKQQKTQRVIEFDCTPLILGSGGGQELVIP